MLDSGSISRLTQREALERLPLVLEHLLSGHYRAEIVTLGPGARNCAAAITGTGFRMVMNIQDWELIHTRILNAPFFDTDGGADPSADPPPDLVQPYHIGAYATVKEPSVEPNQFSYRSPVNRLLRRSGQDGYRAKIRQALVELFPV